MAASGESGVEHGSGASSDTRTGDAPSVPEPNLAGVGRPASPPASTMVAATKASLEEEVKKTTGASSAGAHAHAADSAKHRERSVGPNLRIIRELYEGTTDRE